MNKKILFPIANGTEEAEAVITIDLLRRAGIEVVVAGISEVITTAHNIKIIPDVLLTKISKNDIFDAIVLPGGLGGVNMFMASEHLIDLIQIHHSHGKLIAAVCAAPLVLKAANILKENTKYTCYPSVENEIKGSGFSTENVIQDGNIITSRGIGTALDFALAIIKYLYDDEKSMQIAKEVVYYK